ncbi:MAG: cell division protein FtsL [Bacillota bacterium]|nr:cell division protein FtsL [Bacillota bacterium]
MQQVRQVATAGRIALPKQPTREPVRRPVQGKGLKKVKLLFVVTTCFLLCLVVIAQYSSVVIMNYRLSGARDELGTIKEDIRDLELEAAQLGSVGRIEAIAREELGMIEPAVDQINIIAVNSGELARMGE